MTCTEMRGKGLSKVSVKMASGMTEIILTKLLGVAILATIALAMTLGIRQALRETIDEALVYRIGAVIAGAFFSLVVLAALVMLLLLLGLAITTSTSLLFDWP